MVHNIKPKYCMTNYIQLLIPVSNEQLSDIVAAELSELGFQGFEQDDSLLKAFIPETDFEAYSLSVLFNRYNLAYSKSIIKSENWNALWEKNFEPVAVNDFCLIRADFHSSSTCFKHEIIITPKMSFGTGHHATTYMMAEQMQPIDFEGKAVADFGTGTGILAILSEKLGSKYVWAIDNDEWSIENAGENIKKNNCKFIHLSKLDTFATNKKFDIILANINKNVIFENLLALVSGLNAKGKLLLSGLLKEDEIEILRACQHHKLKHVNTVERHNWISILFESKT